MAGSLKSDLLNIEVWFLSFLCFFDEDFFLHVCFLVVVFAETARLFLNAIEFIPVA